MQEKELLGEEFGALTPVHFFTIQGQISRLPANHKGSILKLGTLPDLSGLCGESPVAQLAGAWGDEGLLFELHVEGDFAHPVFPRLEEGDSLELFIDTRDLKSTGFNHRFCHHFYILPIELKGVPRAGEVTRFRTEDSHDLCPPGELKVVDLSRSSWQFWIPKNCLVGYDPDQSETIGFTYRLNRWAKRSQQHYAVHSREYSVDQLPGLWSSMRLVR
jgi:hypothetical protein